MALRFGPGPVFAYEWRTRSRRWQGYAMRVFVVICLLAALFLGWDAASREQPRFERGTLLLEDLTQIGSRFYLVTILTLFVLVALSAPAATAGAICNDKVRGNLALIFTTDLSATEVILGRLATRLIPVLGTVACATPVLAIVTTFGGVDPNLMIGALLAVATSAIFGCSLALTLSVWGRKTHEVLMATYTIGVLLLLAWPIWTKIQGVVPGPGLVDPITYGLTVLNPIVMLIAPVESLPFARSLGLQAYLTYCGIALFASLGLIVLSIRTVRTRVLADLGSVRATSPRSRRAFFKGWFDWLGRRHNAMAGGITALFSLGGPVSLDQNPVLWRERHHKAPSHWGRAIWSLYAVTIVGASILSILFGSPHQDIPMINAIQILIGMLLVCVTSATSLAEERRRGSLDVLLTTPLPTRAIVWAKWWSNYRIVPLLAIVPVGAACLAKAGPLMFIGLALIVMSAQRFVGLVRWAVRRLKSERLKRLLTVLVFLAILFILLRPLEFYFQVGLLALMILAFGASTTGLGLLLATGIRRMGIAAGSAVAIYLIVAVASIPIAFTLLGRSSGNFGPQVACISPFWGTGSFTDAIKLNWDHLSRYDEEAVYGAYFSITFHLMMAVVFYGCTLLIFNRCLGRVDDPISWIDARLFRFSGRSSSFPVRPEAPVDPVV